ncbi:MAG: heme-binding protein [Gemmatimonadota bacterium]
MTHIIPPRRRALTLGSIAALGLLALATACSSDSSVTAATNRSRFDGRLPTHDELQAALEFARNTPNGGFNLDMWAAVVDRSGKVVAVAYTGAKEGDQWQGSRVIAAQKANTGNAFSLPGLALSSANLYAPTQPGGTLFGLQESNPVDPDVAYRGNVKDFGTDHDPMVGGRIGGINVFGGGFPLYASDGTLLGGLGVSGDASCADHNIGWKTRDRLNLDFVPAGVSPTSDDNIIYDMDADGHSASGFGHPECSDAATAISNALPHDYPISH